MAFPSSNFVLARSASTFAHFSLDTRRNLWVSSVEVNRPFQVDIGKGAAQHSIQTTLTASSSSHIARNINRAASLHLYLQEAGDTEMET